MQKDFIISDKLADTVEVLLNTPKGCFATVMGYVSTSGRTKAEVSDINFISRFSVENVYKNRLESLKNLSPKASDNIDLFNEAKGELITSLEKTLMGVREDAQRKAHDRNYVSFGNGVVGHFKVHKVDGIMVPVLEHGLPVVESIMLNILENGRKIIEKGEYKVVNSSKKTIMKREIEGRLPKSTRIKRLSLKEGKFDSVRIGGEVVS